MKVKYFVAALQSNNTCNNRLNLSKCQSVGTVHFVAIKELRRLAHPQYSEYFSIIFIIFHHPSLPPEECSHPLFPPLPALHACVYCVFFFCHCNHATARCSQDGIIGENVCAAYFSQGLSLANYCLDGSQRFSPITCIFPVSRVDAGQGSARTVSMVLSLAMVLPLSREVAHSSPYYKFWQVKSLNYIEGTPHVPLLP